MTFNENDPNFEKCEGTYFREFKKAYYQLLFEKQWADDVYEMEETHFSLVSIILEYGHRIQPWYLSDNPLE